MAVAEHLSTVERGDWIAEATLRIVDALTSCDEAALLARVRRARQDPETVNGSLSDRMPLAMTLALLRPMRLLNVTGRGPTCVGELPFGQVHPAARCCRDLAVDDGTPTARPLGEWVARQSLEVWIVDAAAWKRRLGQAESASAVMAVDAAFARCYGQTVAASRLCELPMGPLEGAAGIELTLEDGTIAITATATEIQPIALLNTRLTASLAAPHPRWCFDDAQGARRRVALAASAGVIVQPSPVCFGETQPAYF